MKKFKILTFMALAIVVSAMMLTSCSKDKSESGGKRRPPAVETRPATSVTNNTATLVGNISDEGSPAYTDKGFTVERQNNSGNWESHTDVSVSGNGTGKYEYNLTGLSSSTNYRYMAWAESKQGRVEGDYITFTTIGGGGGGAVETYPAINVGNYSATLVGYVYSDYMVKGFKIEYKVSSQWEYWNDVSMYYDGMGRYEYYLSDLNSSTEYRYYAYIQGDAGSYNGDYEYFTTTGGGGGSSVETYPAINVGNYSATLVGYVYGDYTYKGFRIEYYSYYTSQWEYWDNVSMYYDGTGRYEYYLSGLNSSTEYRYYAYIQGEGGNASGDYMSFTTTGGGGGDGCAVRFQKLDSYMYCTAMSVDDEYEEELAYHYFGDYSGISLYYPIPPGYHNPLFYNQYNENWYYCLDYPYSYYFEPGRKYTVVCTDDGDYLYFYVIDDGYISKSDVISKTAPKAFMMSKTVANAQKIKAKATVRK